MAPESDRSTPEGPPKPMHGGVSRRADLELRADPPGSPSPGRRRTRRSIGAAPTGLAGAGETGEPASARLRWTVLRSDGGERGAAGSTAESQGRLFEPETVVARRLGHGAFEGTEFLEVRAQRVLNEVPASSRMPFRWTVNPYRGCSHACTYCFARPTHAWLGLGIGEDFERKIVVKVNAPERLRAELASPRWRGDTVALGTNTDPYQPAEGRYRLTRGVVEALSDAANPFSILTKSTLILSDLSRLVQASQRTDVRVNFSVGTLDEEVWKATEPGTPHPRQRVAALRRLNEAGIPTGVLIAPILPGLSDRPEQLEAVVEAVVEAGAVSVSTVALHLRPGVDEHFLGWLRSARPDLLDLYQVRFGGRAYQHPSVQGALGRDVERLVAEARSR